MKAASSHWEKLTVDQAQSIAVAMLQAMADELKRMGVPFSHEALRDIVRIAPDAVIRYALIAGLGTGETLNAIRDGIQRGVGDLADVRMMRMDGEA